EKSLTAQILHTYETRLFPSADSIEVKRTFIEKFATILVTEFPGWEVDIHVFGSSVNGLGTSRSDVDICLTTEHRELEDIFLLNKVLRKHNMRTYCIPRARVPIVKIWDPELRIASDINVNNTIALHNTRMLQTFVAVDGRVRPFVLAIKHWTKCRDINDAAFGGTLSSYTWVNLAIHFLQTRDPPILPVLHPRAHSLNAEKCMALGEVDLSFNDNIGELREFGRANLESLGFLLYAFFRTYAYEFDYRTQVVSLRNGCYLTKAQKGWDTGRPSRIFCIEEPFSTWLNLGHSANTIAVEGIRREFQRA
ncbi:PAP/OAS1 substrate-binding domain-containing protein, partial [Coemansia reversa NRRL 1564]